MSTIKAKRLMTTAAAAMARALFASALCQRPRLPKQVPLPLSTLILSSTIAHHRSDSEELVTTAAEGPGGPHSRAAANPPSMLVPLGHGSQWFPVVGMPLGTGPFGQRRGELDS